MGKKANVGSIVNRTLLVFGAITLAGVANAQFSLGGGTYLPTSKAVQDVFGESTFAWGPGFGPATRQGRKGLGFDFTGLAMSAGSNRFFSLGALYGYEWQSAKPDSKVVNYARVGTGLGYYDYDINALSLGAFSGRGFRSISAAEYGVVFGGRFTLSAQYMLFPEINGVDFSGLRLQALFTIR